MVNGGAGTIDSDELDYPENYATVFLADQGMCMFVYIIAQYVVYLISKITGIIIVNRVKADYDEKRATIQNRV